jgi:hypothetical protein
MTNNDMRLAIKRYDLINLIIKKYDYKSYLEIGTRNPDDCFDKIYCEAKHGVDPHPEVPCKYIMTSDDFFKKNNLKYDCIFIDGMHDYEYVDRDICNAKKCLTKNGTIIIHDCNPPTKEQQVKFCERGSRWYGSVWRAWVKALSNRGWYGYTVDTDCGIGIFKRGKNQYKKLDIITYEDFSENRKEALNLISVEDFLEKLQNEKIQ